MEKKNRKSFGFLAGIFFVIIELFLMLTGIIMSVYCIYSNSIRGYEQKSDVVLRYATDAVTMADLQKYNDSLTMDENYQSIRHKLMEIKEHDTQITYLYIVKVTPDGFMYLFDVDQSYTGCKLGEVQKQETEVERRMDKLYKGENVSPFYVHWEEYGSLFTTLKPIGQLEDGSYCYLGVDYWVDDLINQMKEELQRIILVYIGIGVLLAVVIGFYFRKRISQPLNTLAEGARDYMAEGYSRQCRERLAELKVDKYKEIENLHESMVKMGMDIDEYVESIRNITWESEHDAMTMLHNRAKYRKRAEEEYMNADSLFVVYLDVNNLKEMNDLYGHASGDAVILKLAEKLRMITSDKIHTYRWGGDEFLIVMCNYKQDEAKAFFESWYQRIGRLNRATDPILCTVAYGYSYASGKCVLDTIVNLADEAMYRTKSRQKRDEHIKKQK